MFRFLVMLSFLFWFDLHALLTFREIARKALPAVVMVRASQVFIEGPDQETVKGTGFLMSDNGYILTNAHLVENAQIISIIYHDTEIPSSLIGLDKQADIAILKIEGEHFPYLNLGDSDEIEIGDQVIAAGGFISLKPLLTKGIISGRNSFISKSGDFEDLLFTDALINPGNSGGPLLNLTNEVIGINKAIFLPTGGFVGYGVAIPVNVAKNSIFKIMKLETTMKNKS